MKLIITSMLLIFGVVGISISVTKLAHADRVQECTTQVVHVYQSTNGVCGQDEVMLGLGSFNRWVFCGKLLVTCP